ncbi:hypothetical protein OS493_020801 [Desmophyllum pertusum]|uniref:Uncharacterized protein n=1 Tax=Desmophyllum pertusum TaxID=174260 RepID=A0A9W9YB35_9CNID|nr:hypothetical protein OS493_020801 [Desmophyllum pertusum]
MKSRFLFLVIFLSTWMSSFPLSDDKCGEVYTAMCTKNSVGQYHQSRSSGDISWICRGRFGIIKLNCTGIGTNKTAQTMHSCCEATVNHHGKEETYQKVICVMNCTNCGYEAASFVSHDKWQCQWNSARLVVDIQGRMRFHTLCNGTTRPLAKGHCIERFSHKSGKKHPYQELRFQAYPDRRNVHYPQHRVLNTAILKYLIAASLGIAQVQAILHIFI